MGPRIARTQRGDAKNDGEIHRHCFAAFGMMFGWEMVGRMMGPRMREDGRDFGGGDGSEIPRGTWNGHLVQEEGMGTRMREDNGSGGDSRTRFLRGTRKI